MVTQVPGQPEDSISNTSIRNRFDRMEWAGAFGDLGTLIPFVVGYITVLKMDPSGILFAFGIAMLLCGSYYRTPFPVQPMKAIGAIAITQAAIVTPAAIISAALITGIIWLILGLTGAASRVSKWVPRPVVAGIILGLGFSFMLEGIKMMSTHWPVALIALTGTVLLLTNRRIPAMFLLLLFGAGYGFYLSPEAFQQLAAVPITLRVPELALLDIDWNDLYVGLIILALPQLPLTLGNAVIAIKAENNRLFPDRPVSEKTVAVSTGLMNIGAASVGGVPMCHGAGGMAGHTLFGARTGGALIILGALLLILGLFFSASIGTLFGIFPPAVIGVILFMAGTQLALGCFQSRHKKPALMIMMMTALVSMWNIGIAFLMGIALYHIINKIEKAPNPG